MFDFAPLTVALDLFLLRLKAKSFESTPTQHYILVLLLKETLKNSFLTIKKTLCKVWASVYTKTVHKIQNFNLQQQQ